MYLPDLVSIYFNAATIVTPIASVKKILLEIIICFEANKNPSKIFPENIIAAAPYKRYIYFFISWV